MTSKDNTKPFYYHQKAKSISTKVSLKDFPLSSQNSINNNSCIHLNELDKQKISTENKPNNNCNNVNLILDNMRQNILDVYYDNNSNFKNKIDESNLKFYLETEKYLKNNEIQKNQQLQANLFIILFEQINILLEEIERLNKIIIENKFEKERILRRTNELNEKNDKFKIKEDLITLLKKSNKNIEKKLLETLLNEDKLIKDNQRLRQENETLKNIEKKNSSLSPKRQVISKHVKTYSDYGVTMTQSNRENYQQSTNINSCTISKNQLLISEQKSIDKSKSGSKNKNKLKNNINENNCNNKLIRANTGIENNSGKIKKTNNKKKICSLCKINNKNANCNNKIKVGNSNASKNNNNNINSSKKIVRYKKINFSNENNNTMTNTQININNRPLAEETKENSSFDKKEKKKFRKLDNNIGYTKKRTMSNISFNEIITVQILNDEFNKTINIANSKGLNKIKDANFNIKKSLSNKNKCKTKKNNNKATDKNITIQDCCNNFMGNNIKKFTITGKSQECANKNSK